MLIAFAVLGFTLFSLFPAIMFHFYEGWSYFDSIYFTIITLTTIGFGDFVAGKAGLDRSWYTPSYIQSHFIRSISCTDGGESCCIFSKRKRALSSAQTVLHLAAIILVASPAAEVDSIQTWKRGWRKPAVCLDEQVVRTACMGQIHGLVSCRNHDSWSNAKSRCLIVKSFCSDVV